MTLAPPKPAQPRQLLTLLQSQRDGYLRLIELGRQQTQLIDAGQPEQLLAVLSRRQSLIEEMAELGSEVSAYHAHWPDIAAELGAGEAQRARALVAEVQQLLATILEQDERDRARLAEAHRQTGRQLRQTAAAPRALGAYKAAASTPARFTDRNG